MKVLAAVVGALCLGCFCTGIPAPTPDNSGHDEVKLLSIKLTDKIRDLTSFLTSQDGAVMSDAKVKIDNILSFIDSLQLFTSDYEIERTYAEAAENELTQILEEIIVANPSTILSLVKDLPTEPLSTENASMILSVRALQNVTSKFEEMLKTSDVQLSVETILRGSLETKLVLDSLHAIIESIEQNAYEIVAREESRRLGDDDDDVEDVEDQTPEPIRMKRQIKTDIKIGKNHKIGLGGYTYKKGNLKINVKPNVTFKGGKPKLDGGQIKVTWKFG